MEKSTIDPEQMEHFDTLARVWWDKTGVMKPLHAMNDLRISLFQRCLHEIGMVDLDADVPLEGLSVLDVGCGGGILTEPLSLLGCIITGIDPNIELLNMARARASCEHLNIEYICSTIEEHMMDNKEKYDIVIASETIEHVIEKEIFVKYCIECLKPGGSIFVTSKCKSWTSKFIVITVAEKVLGRFPRGTHKYRNFISLHKLSKLLNKENCEIMFTSGMMYNPWTNKWMLINNRSLQHYVIHAVKQDSEHFEK